MTYAASSINNGIYFEEHDTHLHDLGQDIEKPEDIVAHEVVVPVVVLVLPGQEKRLDELTGVAVRDGDRPGHHQQHAICTKMRRGGGGGDM